MSSMSKKLSLIVREDRQRQTTKVQSVATIPCQNQNQGYDINI
jgi:hypothetical protein